MGPDPGVPKTCGSGSPTLVSLYINVQYEEDEEEDSGVVTGCNLFVAKKCEKCCTVVTVLCSEAPGLVCEATVEEDCQRCMRNVKASCRDMENCRQRSFPSYLQGFADPDPVLIGSGSGIRFVQDFLIP